MTLPNGGHVEEGSRQPEKFLSGYSILPTLGCISTLNILI
jgi:hypothetical protein